MIAGLRARLPWRGLDDPAGVTLRLTMLTLALHGPTAGALRPALLGVGLLCAVIPGMATRTPAWACVTLLMVPANVVGWASLTAPDWLLTYWSLACLLSTLSEDPTASLETNARGLLMVCFAVVVGRRLVAWGTTGVEPFLLAVMMDGRFLAPEANLDSLVALLNTPGGADVPLAPRPGGLALARVINVLATGGEAALAWAWVRPGRKGGPGAGPGLLLAFVLLVYPLAPVTSFGWTLCALGHAGSLRASANTRWAFVAAACYVSAVSALRRTETIEALLRAVVPI